MASERKAQAIYSAVHEQIMNLRIRLARANWANGAKLDVEIAQAGDAAGSAAVAAYRKPLRKQRLTSHD